MHRGSLIAWDTETALVAPGLLAPPLACVSYASPEPALSGCGRRGLMGPDTGLARLGCWLEADSITLVGHRVAYDFAVAAAAEPELLPAIFAAHDAGRVLDTRVRERLLDIADPDQGLSPDRGRYSLEGLAGRYLGVQLEKGTWQLCYGSLRFVPLERWPESARRYPVADAEATLGVILAQAERAEALHASLRGRGIEAHPLANEAEQVRHAWAFHLGQAWGVRTDGKAVDDLLAALREEDEKDRDYLVARGLVVPVFRGRKPNKVHVGWKKEQKLAQSLADELARKKGVEILRTPTGKPQLTEDAVAMLGSEQLVTYQRYSSRGAYATNVEKLLQGVDVPIGLVYESLQETGRSSASGDIRQNPPRKGGYRECIVPRPEHLFFGADYRNQELCCLAQVQLLALGRSTLADALNAGQDVHVRMAAAIEGVDYGTMAGRVAAKEPRAKELRQLAKIPNFGLPGGMGPEALVSFARGYGVTLSIEDAAKLRDAWHETWPEMRDYFGWVQEYVEASDGVVVQLGSDRVRAGVGFCDAANGFFQGLAADMSKHAYYEVTRACYVDDDDRRLFGCRVPLFLHDEIIGEAPQARAADAGEALSQIMERVAREWCPDVPPSADPYLMRRWYKGAETVRDGSGRLVPWEPEA